jgi:hypothetical protein
MSANRFIRATLAIVSTGRSGTVELAPKPQARDTKPKVQRKAPDQQAPLSTGRARKSGLAI